MTTKEKILLAASEEFADKGYKAATVRDICSKAGVNVAAVNYHFSSKEVLYGKVFEFLLDKTKSERPESLDLDINSEEQWHNAIRAFLYRMIKKCTSDDKYERYLHALFAMEEASPSDQFSAIYQALLAPRVEAMKDLFRFGQFGSEEELGVWVVCIISMALGFSEKKQLVAHMTGNANFGADNLDVVVDSIFERIKGGLKYRDSQHEK